MATIVPTSEEDPALSVVRFTSELSWSDAGPEAAEEQVNRLCVEAQECIVTGRWLDLASLMLTSADVIFSNSKVSDKDLECIFTVICSLVAKPESGEEAHEMAKLICTKIIQQPTDKPALRLKILFNLYNLLENAYSRFHVYMNILNLSISGKVTELVIPSFKKVDNFLKEWDLEVKCQRELFLSIANVLKESKSSSKDAFKFLTKFLATFSGEDAYIIAEAKEEAVHAIIEFVKAPDMFQCDLLGMPTVGQLEKDDKYSLVYQLLKIFLTQRLDAYLEFQAANSALLKSYGDNLCFIEFNHILVGLNAYSSDIFFFNLDGLDLVHEDCVTKMRLLSLVDLASGESHQIPYFLIKDTLQINDDEVELWVVKAITAKLIDCKMDQMNQVVVVSRYTDRVFGQQQWEALRTKLAIWRGNVTHVISTIQANKIAEDGSQAVQGLAIR